MEAEGAPSAEVLATIASIVAAAGVTMLFFRITRELMVREASPEKWIVRALTSTERKSDSYAHALPEKTQPAWIARGLTEPKINWIAYADRLLIGATLTALAVGLLPLLLFADSELVGKRIPAAGCTASVAALAGYIPSILAHYRLLFGSKREGEFENPEPAERLLVNWSAALTVAVFAASLVSTG